jgi:DNA-binding response OmpR family regulator
MKTLTDMLKKIIIADDDPGILDAVGMMLEFEGYQVIRMENCEGLLKIMEQELPDLLLLDIWMSGTDGRDICMQLKASELTRHLPVVMISASYEIGASALEAGADDFLAKPFDIEDLLAKVQKNIII